MRAKEAKMGITSLDKLHKTLNDFQIALSELDGKLGTVSFDPEDPASIDQAVREMEAFIDTRIGNYAGNKMLASLIDSTKERFRTAILERAMQARLEANND